MTKKSSASLSVRPSTDTWPSAIASRSADWVRGEARLISSASKTFVKIAPLEMEGVIALVEDRHAQDVRRQEVGRELDALERGADRPGEGLGERRLAGAR